MSEPFIDETVKFVRAIEEAMENGRRTERVRVRETITRLLKERENADSYRYKNHEHTFVHCEYSHFAEELLVALGYERKEATR